MINRPKCAKCKKLVTHLQVRLSLEGLHFHAVCHGSVDTVIVPMEYLKKTTGKAKIEYGEAFK